MDGNGSGNESKGSQPTSIVEKAGHKTTHSGKHENNNDSSCKSNAENGSASRSTKDEIKLRREIGLLEAVAITVGAIIGSGIFISPKGIVRHIGSIGGSIVIWMVCGVLSLLGSFSYAELGTMFPSAGGTYTYLYESFGPAVAFLYLWVNNMGLIPLSNAILGLTFSKYVWQPFFPIGCPVPELAVRLLAMVGIMLLTVINCQGVRQTSKIINVFMYLKVFALGLIIAVGAYVLATGQYNASNLENIWRGTNPTAEGIVYSIFSGMYAFGGWQAMSTMMEELKEPEKNLPRAIFISIGLVTVVYILTNLAYFMVLSPAEMLASDAVAVTFIGKFWGYLIWIVPVFVAVSTFGSLGIHIMTTARYCFVGARCGHLPSTLGLISVSNHTPISSIIFLSLLSILFMYTSDVFALINLLAVVNSLFQAIVFGGSVYFYFRRKDLDRPFKVPLIVPILNIIVSVLFFVIPVYIEPVNTGISIILTLSGLPVYYLVVANDKVPRWIRTFDEWTTVTTQKLLMAVKED